MTVRVRILGILVVALGGLLAAACSDDPTPTPRPTPTAAPTATAAPVATPTPSWEEEWAAVLEGAREEGEINIISGSSSVQQMPSFTAAFEEMTGGEVNFTELRAPDVVARLPEEYAAGLRNWDIVLLGGSSGLSEGLDEAGVLGDLNETFVLPEVTDDDSWIGDFEDIWLDQDTQKYKIHHHSSGLSRGAAWWVNREELPLSKFSELEDIFEIPEVKGRFCTFDPRVEGASDSNFGQIALMWGEDMVRRLFTELDMVVIRDYRKLTEDTVRGECWITIGARIQNFHVEGVGLHIQQAYMFKEGLDPEVSADLKNTCCGEGKDADGLDGFVGGGSSNNMLSIANEPKNPNAQKVFVNWLLSREGQQAWGLPDRSADCSRRSDLVDFCVNSRAGTPYAHDPMMEDGTYIDPHARSNYYIRLISHEIGFEVFGR